MFEKNIFLLVVISFQMSSTKFLPSIFNLYFSPIFGSFKILCSSLLLAFRIFTFLGDKLLLIFLYGTYNSMGGRIQSFA